MNVGERLQEDLLQQIGELAVEADQVRDNALDVARVPLEERRPGVGVPFAQTLDERAVVHPELRGDDQAL